MATHFPKSQKGNTTELGLVSLCIIGLIIGVFVLYPRLQVNEAAKAAAAASLTHRIPSAQPAPVRPTITSRPPVSNSPPL